MPEHLSPLAELTAARVREEGAAVKVWDQLPQYRRRAYLLDATRHIGLPRHMRHLNDPDTVRKLEAATLEVQILTQSTHAHGAVLVAQNTPAH